MKGMLLPLISVVFLVLGISSCKKTTSKVQLANDWKVTSYEEKTTLTTSDGSWSTTSINSISMSETEIAKFNFSPPVEWGEVALNKLTIKKDGTWEWDQDYTFVDSGSSQSIRSQTIRKQSGTWNFMGKSKNDGFRKNERVFFNILVDNAAYYQSVDGNPAYSQGSTSQSYSTGEKTMVFRITSSTYREIRMESDFKNTSTDEFGTTTVESIKKVTLRNK